MSRNNNSPIVISDDDEPMVAVPAPPPPAADADEVASRGASPVADADAVEPVSHRESDVSQDMSPAVDSDADDSQPLSDVPLNASPKADADEGVQDDDNMDDFVVPDDDAVAKALAKDSKEALAADAESDADETQPMDDDSQANRDPNADPDASTQSQVVGSAFMLAAAAAATAAADAATVAAAKLKEARDAELETESEIDASDLDYESDDSEDGDEKDSGASKLDMKVDDSFSKEIPSITMQFLTDLSKANRPLGPAIPEEVHDDSLPPNDRYMAIKRYRDVLYAYQQQLRKIALAAHKKDFDEKVKIGDVPTSTKFVTVRSNNVTGFDMKLLPMLEKNELFSVWKGFYHAISAKIKVAADFMKRAELESSAAHKAAAGGALENTIGIVTWLKQYEPYIGGHFAKSERAVAETLQTFARFEEKKADWKTFDDSFADKEGPAIMAAIPDTKCLEDDVLKGITSCQYAAFVQRTLAHTLLVKCRVELTLLLLMDVLCHPEKGIAIDRYAVYDPASQLEEASLRTLLLRSSRVSGQPVSEIRSNISRAFPGGDGAVDEQKEGYLDVDLPKRQFGKCRIVDIALHVAADNIPDVRAAIDECGGCTQLCVSTLVDENKDPLRVQFPDPHLTPAVVREAIKLKIQRRKYLSSAQWAEESYALFLPSLHAVQKGISDWSYRYDRSSLDASIAACKAMTAFVRRRFDYARKGVIRSHGDISVLRHEFTRLINAWTVLSNPSFSAGAGLSLPPAQNAVFEIRMVTADAAEEKKLSKREREMTAEDLADEKQIEVGARQSALLEKNQQYQTHHAHFAMADADLNRDLRIVKSGGFGGGADSFISNLNGYEQIIERRLRARKRSAMTMLEAAAESSDDEIEVAARKLVVMNEEGDRPRPAKRLRRSDD